MATIVNTPAQTDSGSGAGFLLGAVLLVLLVLAVLYYGGSMLRGITGAGSTPSNTVEMNVPDKVDVNVTNPQ